MLSATQPRALERDERDAVIAGLLEQRPELAEDLERAGLSLQLQPYFTRHRIIAVVGESVRLMLAVGEGDEVSVLTDDLAAFNALAALDPPGLLLDEPHVRAYCRFCGHWVGSVSAQEHLLSSFSDIPWRDNLSSHERAVRAAIEARLAEQVHDGAVTRQGEHHFAYDRWLISDRRLVRRRFLLATGGRVSQSDEVLASALPVT